MKVERTDFFHVSSTGWQSVGTGPGRILNLGSTLLPGRLGEEKAAQPAKTGTGPGSPERGKSRTARAGFAVTPGTIFCGPHLDGPSGQRMFVRDSEWRAAEETAS